MELNEIKSVYFIGAGGIGMSALVRYFINEGKFVAGYDKTPCLLTDELIKEGANLHFEDNKELIPEQCRDPLNTLVVFTPAVPQDHTELIWFREKGFNIEKRAQVLGTLTRSLKGLCVAGTHGKTTTATMIAHIMRQTSRGCNAFLGGISKNYNSNYLLSESSEYVVVEADEYDRSFHWLTPFRSVVTSVDADHLDIYGNYENYLESFSHYISLIKPGGDLILREGVSDLLKFNLHRDVTLYTYSVEKGDFHAENIRMGNESIMFDFISPKGIIRDIQLGVPVRINIENGIAAIALAQLSGASDNEIRRGMSTFKGNDRRFDIHIKRPDMVYISDYAHHPIEIRHSAESIIELYSDKKVTAIFQPHLYSRTRDFYKEFAASLSLFDSVYLVDIYPARERPIPGITSQLIAENMKKGVCRGVVSIDGVTDLVKSIKDEIEVLVTLGAGDIESCAEEIEKILNCCSK
ncbi:MAG TPA: UDP-N-acetylmuramate--L-alanine ligase [Bacteroidaceae bacterium]|nr:UDP-N-acetylmuramate--L-alanine ligase [Bacteroidaceae bacterium]